MTIKAEWKKVLNNNEDGKLAVEGIYLDDLERNPNYDENAQLLENGTNCIIAGTYVDEDTNEVSIGYLPAFWWYNGFIMPDDYFNCFRPLYWDFMNIENPIKLSIGELPTL